MSDSLSSDRVLGALLGTAVGDALGMPIAGFSHQNVRTFYKGIKEYRDDERRGDLQAGQWTAHTQRMFAFVRALTGEPRAPNVAAEVFRKELERVDLRRPGSDPIAPTNAVAVASTVIGAFAALDELSETEIISWVETLFVQAHSHSSALSGGVGQALAVAEALRSDAIDGPSFVRSVADVVLKAEKHFGGNHRVSERLVELVGHLNDFPLDIQDLCDGTGAAADESFPFAIVMFARGPDLPEASLLSAINVGGDTSAIGAMVGALLGARHGWSAFPEEWRTGLEDVERLTDEANAFFSIFG